MRALVILLLLTATYLREAVAALDDLGRGEWQATQARRAPISKRRLERDERVGRVLCKAGFDASVDAKGRLVFCYTAREMTLDGLPIAAESPSEFYPSGRVYQAALGAPHEFTLADGRKASCAGMSNMALYPDGRLLHCILERPLAIAPGVSVNGGAAFWNDGHLRWGSIDRPMRVRHALLPAGAVLNWDRSGAVVGGTVREAIEFSGLGSITTFELHAGGNLKKAQLAAPARVQGNDLPAWAEVEFRADGTLERASYVKGSGLTADGGQWYDTHRFEYDRSGKVTSSRVERQREKSPLARTPSR